MVTLNGVFTRKEVLDLFKISAPTLLEWGKKGILHPIKMQRRVYFSKKEISNLLNHKTDCTNGK